VKKKERRFCPYCGGGITQKHEEDILRDYCETCRVFFYDNPLPVVSTIVTDERQILLVKRANDPYKGQWCLPSGFAEIDESIEEAAVRELEEETGLKARIIDLVHVDSCTNYFYGDLIFLTFEAVTIGGKLSPGSDTVAVKYYPIDRIPTLAFDSNTNAIQAYVKDKSVYWAIEDSFTAAVDGRKSQKKNQSLLSDRLVGVIQENKEIIVGNWLKDVETNRSTPTYQSYDKKKLSERARSVLSQFSKWAEEIHKEKGLRSVDVSSYFIGFGKEKREEGFELQEVLSALSLKRKHIWEFALYHGISSKKPVDIYMAFEFDRRMMIFFDRATFYTTWGYMET
jgi:8-oxo-dGTP diphosphatase